MLNFLKIPEVKNLDINSRGAFKIHRKIILSKKILKEIYQEYYDKIFENLRDVNEDIIEIGAGAVSAKDFNYNCLATDVMENEYIDQELDAQKMIFDNESINAYIMINTLHHIPSPNNFFLEAERTLKKGGKIVMIEPYFSIFGRFLFKYFHHELCIETPDWEIPQSSGKRLSESNQMIPFLIFERDLEIFKNKYNFQVSKINYHTFLSYVLSGGLSYIQLAPNYLGFVVKFLDRLAIIFPRIFATSFTIVLEKK